MALESNIEDRVLILAPRGRDASVIDQVASSEAELRLICPDLAAMSEAMMQGAAAAIITEEALAEGDPKCLLDLLAAQPVWSDFPFVVLAVKQGGRRTARAAKALERLGNVVLLERPINAESLVSATASALRGRRRQYQARGQLEATERAQAQLRRSEAELRELNSTLEQQVALRTAELQVNQARLRTIFETSYQHQGVVAPDGTLLDANRTALADIECSLDAVRGELFWNTPWFSGTPGMSETVRAAVQAAAGGTAARLEITLELPTGRRDFDLSIRPVRDDRGEVVAIVPEALEITARVQAEDALRQAQKMEALGQLTGGIAHDFNNLLTGIIGSLDLVRRRLAAGRTEEVAKYMDGAAASAQRAAALTHRLLAFSRRQSLDTRPVDANRLVIGMWDLLHRTLGEQVELVTVPGEGLWPALADANQLENAILNLAINARDAMPGGGRLTIETNNVHLDEAYARVNDGVHAGDYVVICVSDTGVGMAREVVAKAFDPFFTTKPIGQGTGLGLSMIYGFARQSGGHVRIDSEPGKGTTFKLYLPRTAGQDSLDAAIEPAGPPRGRGETVLVVEDDATVRLLVTEVLAELGYRHLEAGEARVAIPILQSRQSIDLLITDVGLPHVNGRQLADIARTHRPELKVLFVTGYAEQAAARSGFLAPGMDMLTKPFDLEALGAKIRKMIEQ